MMIRLSTTPRDRRALAIGALVIGGSFALTRGVPGIRRWTEGARASALELTAEAARASAGVSSQASVSDSMNVRSTRMLALAPALLSGDSPAAAAGTLASLVSGGAAQAQLRLGSVQLTPDSASRQVFSRVAVRAEAVGDIHGISRLLLALERGPTLLAVRQLSITQTDPGALPDRPELLRLELLLEGLALNRGKGAAR